LGQFAITYGYQRYNWAVTAVAVVTIIIVVQLAQFLGNWLARRALRR
ncbi:MAG: ABC transporter permease, partial [Cutibacterium acnes]|nr:ABC transporter permease [Cutibacterium acnes]